MGQLDGLPVGEQLDVDLGGTTAPRAWPADERQHAPVWRQDRRGDRVGEVGERRVLERGWRDRPRERRQQQRAGRGRRNQEGRSHPPSSSVPGREPSPRAARRHGAPRGADRPRRRASTGTGARAPCRAPSRRSGVTAAAPRRTAAPAGDGESRAGHRPRSLRRTVAAPPALRTAPHRRRRCHCGSRAAVLTPAPVTCRRRYRRWCRRASRRRSP